MQNLNHMYFYAAFGKDQFKMKVTLRTSRVCETMATQTEA